jgi:hypothetical protein
MFGLNLIPDWKRAHRFATAWAIAACAALWAAWQFADEPQRAAVINLVGLDYGRWGPLLNFAAILIARFVQQPALHAQPGGAAQLAPTANADQAQPLAWPSLPRPDSGAWAETQVMPTGRELPAQRHKEPGL